MLPAGIAHARWGIVRLWHEKTPNPYMKLLLDALGEAMMWQADALLGGDRVGRRGTANLLIAGSHKVRTDRGSPNAPINLAGTDPDAAQEPPLAVFETERPALRWWIVFRAMDALRFGATRSQ